MLFFLEFLMNASTIVSTLAKLNQSAKYMLKVAKEMLAKGKSSKFSFTYKVTPFLVFVVAKIFFSREETYMFRTQPAFTCSKLTMNTIEKTVEYVQS